MSATAPSTRVEPLTFGRLYAEHAGYVLVSLRRLGVREADVEDVAHEAFIAVYKHFSTYDPARPLRPWLFAFAARCASDYRKRVGRRHEELGDPDAPEREPASPRVGGDAERRLVLRETLDDVLRILWELDEDKRELIILHDIDEVPVPVIAEALGIPLNTAYSRLRLAREAFEARVEKYENQTTTRRSR